MAATASLLSPIILLLFVAGIAASSPAHQQLRNLNTQNIGSLELFRHYLRIPTFHPNPDYQPAVEFLVSLANSIGFDRVQVVEFVLKKPVILLTWQGTDPSLPSVFLNSHMDVVPVTHNEWKHHPFEAVMEENGDIYARGAQDTKCVGIQYLEAIRNLKRQDFKSVRNIHVSFVPDEEIGGADGFGKLINSSVFKSLNVGVALDEGLTSESGNYIVTNAERSPWSLEIKAFGRPGHGSRLYDNSAMENLIKSLEAIEKFRASQFDLVKAGLAKDGEVTSINAVYLKAGVATPGGFAMNIQPSEAEAGFDMRIQPGADVAFLERLISEQWAPRVRNMSCKFLNKVQDQGYTPADDTNPWWGLLLDAINRAGGKLTGAEARHSSTDGRFMRGAGIPTFGFSPIANTPVRQHNADEFLNAEQLLRGIAVYEEVIKAYGSFDGRYSQ